MRWSLLLLPLLALGLTMGCSESTTPVDTLTPAEQFDAMVAAAETYINDDTQCPGVMAATALQADLDNYTVIDIRSEADYDAGHIPGAYHSSLGTLLADLGTRAIPTDQNIVVACYTGQTAGHAKIALEMLYPAIDIFSLKFGMAAWNETLTAKWDNNCKDELTNPDQTDENGNLTTHDFPGFDTGVTNVDEVVPARVAWMLGEGFKAKSFDQIKDNLDDYFIMNYFGQADYLGQGGSGVPGHIPGAFQFTPYASLGNEQMLNNLPTEQDIVVYCWTGQHSSQVTAYLNMLGYTAFSLKFGSNYLFHSDLTGHKWSAGATNAFTLENTVTAPFSGMATPGGAYVNGGTCPGVILATDLQADLENYTVVDIRDAADYDAGHIEGAINSSLGTLLADIDAGTIPTDQDIVVACYSGQTAGIAKIALDLLYDDIDIFSLKWGMASWNSSLTGPWDGKTGANGNNLGNPSQDDENSNLTRHGFPKLEGYDAATVLEERVAWMLAEGLQGVLYANIDPDDYFIVNYFGYDDYMGQGGSGVPGHIPGAYQFTPAASLEMDQMLYNLPLDEQILVYCWTGQTSAQITGYLRMLGYDAYSLKFGSNNLFYDDLTGHKWSAAQTNDFPLVPTALP